MSSAVPLIPLVGNGFHLAAESPKQVITASTMPPGGVAWYACAGLASVALLTRDARPGRVRARAAVAMAAPFAVAAVQRATESRLLHLARPLSAEEAPSWHHALVGDLLVNDLDKGRGPGAMLVPFEGLDLVVVNQAFLDADTATQKDRFNAAVSRKVSHRYLDATMTAAITGAGYWYRHLVVGDRGRLSVRRAVGMVLTHQVGVMALTALKEQTLAIIEPPRLRA